MGKLSMGRLQFRRKFEPQPRDPNGNASSILFQSSCVPTGFKIVGNKNWISIVNLKLHINDNLGYVVYVVIQTMFKLVSKYVLHIAT